VSAAGRLPRELAGLARRSAGLPAFLRRPLDPALVGGIVGERVRRRGVAFFDAAERLIYGVADSPLRRLLLWAGCEAGDLRHMVREDGLEAALERLHAAGVRVSADELRGRTPLRRSGLELALAPHDFANPSVLGAVAGASSGTTAGGDVATGGEAEPRGSRQARAAGGPGESVRRGGNGEPLRRLRRRRRREGAGGMPVSYSWEFLEAEAAHELLLLESHGLTDSPLALWMPGLPGIAGLHNLLAHAKLGRPPRRWFSPSPAPAAGDGLAFWADRGWRAARRFLPALGPAVEWAPMERAAEVARWLAGEPTPALLKCFASAALRLASAAREEGLDLAGNVVFAGGEPLTAARRRFLAQSGLQVYARYAATETGFLAGACPHGASGADMHLYADRVALINGQPDGLPGPLAVTSLSLAAPLVLLNVELGDHGTLRRQPCGCALGRAGLDWRVAEVHSPAKIAAEGVKLGEVDFTRLVEAAVRDLGGGPDDFQIWLGEREDGAARPAVVLAPHAPIEPAALRTRLRQRLPELSGGALAAHLWLDGGGLAVERRPLAPGPGQKMRRIVRQALPDEGPMELDPAAGRSGQGLPGSRTRGAPRHLGRAAPPDQDRAAIPDLDQGASPDLDRAASPDLDRGAPPDLDRAAPWRLDPAAWALVHDRREARDFAFWRGLELAREVCAERIRPGELWLEVGCGPGHLTAALALAGASVLGIDLDPRMARYARRRWRQPFAVADASCLPIADRRCAGIVAVSLLGCLPLPAAFFAAAARVLAPGGTLCFTAMNRHSLLLAAARALSWRGHGGSPLYTAHDPAALTQALRRAGFIPERQVCYGHFFAAGRVTVPNPTAAQRRERAAPPGRRDAWARQILLVARRAEC
jgi:SAM-dependent methyltransferase